MEPAMAVVPAVAAVQVAAAAQAAAVAVAQAAAVALEILVQLGLPQTHNSDPLTYSVTPLEFTPVVFTTGVNRLCYGLESRCDPLEYLRCAKTTCI
jgi:hypothetical protein